MMKRSDRFKTAVDLTSDAQSHSEHDPVNSVISGGTGEEAGSRPPAPRGTTPAEKPAARTLNSYGPLKTLDSSFSVSDVSDDDVMLLEPDNVDGSFIQDRLVQYDDDTFLDLLESIRDQGQIAPILVRRESGNRYRCAYGHRRLEACRRLGVKVRAIERELSDEALVLAQAHENIQRRDLTYLEKSLFCFRLHSTSYLTEPGIRRALNIDKTEMSRLLLVAKNLDDDILGILGNAMDVGRRNLVRLATTLRDGGPAVRERVQNIIDAERRFRDESGKQSTADHLIKEMLLALQSGTKVDQTETKPIDQEGHIQVVRTSQTKVDVLKVPNANGFASWLWSNLPELHDQWQRQSTKSGRRPRAKGGTDMP